MAQAHLTQIRGIKTLAKRSRQGGGPFPADSALTLVNNRQNFPVSCVTCQLFLIMTLCYLLAFVMLRGLKQFGHQSLSQPHVRVLGTVIQAHSSVVTPVDL